MQTVHANLSVSMSEFKKNLAAVLRESRNRPVAVLNHNRPAFYLVEPELFEAMMAVAGRPGQDGRRPGCARAR